MTNLNKKEKVYIYIYFIEFSYTEWYTTLYTQIKNLTQNIICFLTNMSLLVQSWNKAHPTPPPPKKKSHSRCGYLIADSLSISILAESTMLMIHLQLTMRTCTWKSCTRMVEFMEPMTMEEWKLLSVAYKHMIKAQLITPSLL